MNTNPKLLFYSMLLEFLKIPVVDMSKLTIRTTNVRRSLLQHSKHVTFTVPSIEELEAEYDNIHGHEKPIPGDLTRRAASAAFQDLSPQLRSFQPCVLLGWYLELIGDPTVMLGHILAIKELGNGAAGQGFVEVKMRVTNLDLLKHLLGVIQPMELVEPWTTSAV